MSESFAALFEESLARSNMKSGQVISAEVVRIDHNFVVVNAGLKSEAFIPVEEFHNDQGEIDVQPGDFVSVGVSQGLRDVMYQHSINPLTFFQGTGLVNYGNKSLVTPGTALDRINVARLVNYIRSLMNTLARPFLFEPNDSITRVQIRQVISSLLNDLVAKRGITDYTVVCDDTNNTPFRVANNELWVDVAVEPVKAAEFIYIPVRILNTGELAGA